MNETLNQIFRVNHVDWSKNATIYEVHIRQYTPSGTLNEFSEHLPRLKALGVDILWLMPIQPIGEKNRKGSMGSPYAIKDYVSVNPDIGTLDDFKKLVNQAHQMGMHVIIDWVANHTAWDHTWISQHPEFYMHDEAGNIIHPAHTDWFDVADLNFENHDLRTEMINSLKYWILETGIDGYRCDMAGLVPTDFWETLREELDKIKPVFMLAEAEQPDLHYKAFDVTYNWAIHHMMNDIAVGNRSIWHLDEFFNNDVNNYGTNALRLYFTSNHDENKNAGSAIERLGNATKAMAFLTYTWPGIPLIFSGQEVGLNRRLDFFGKDLIDWSGGEEFTEFYTKLCEMRKSNKALWSGFEGGNVQRIYADNNDKIYAFVRKKEKNHVLAIVNLSPEYQHFNMNSAKEFINADSFFFDQNFETDNRTLAPWGYDLFIKEG